MMWLEHPLHLICYITFFHPDGAYYDDSNYKNADGYRVFDLQYLQDMGYPSQANVTISYLGQEISSEVKGGLFNTRITASTGDYSNVKFNMIFEKVIIKDIFTSGGDISDLLMLDCGFNNVIVRDAVGGGIIVDATSGGSNPIKFMNVHDEMLNFISPSFRRGLDLVNTVNVFDR